MNNIFFKKYWTKNIERKSFDFAVFYFLQGLTVWRLGVHLEIFRHGWNKTSWSCFLQWYIIFNSWSFKRRILQRRALFSPGWWSSSWLWYLYSVLTRSAVVPHLGPWWWVIMTTYPSPNLISLLSPNLQRVQTPEASSFLTFISRLSMIVRVNVVLNRTVVVDSDWRFDNLCGSYLQSQSDVYHVSWWY